MLLFACACITNERLTPELGYAVQPSSAVATRVSITVSAAETEQTQREKKTAVSLSPQNVLSIIQQIQTAFRPQRSLDTIINEFKGDESSAAFHPSLLDSC